MTSKTRMEAIRLLEEATGFEYPMRWVDEQTTMGDFDGREFTIDVFRVPPSEDFVFLSKIRAARDRIYKMIGSRCLFIFHSPEATRGHYAHLFPDSRLEGLHVTRTPIRLTLPLTHGVINISKPLSIVLKEAA
ncbi:MAG: hypothetical protein HY894_08540 [Deltaproteobacteria bacterium]|nr:hypothetical protein [Deltaproteobacteria bacterium]